MKKKVSLFVIIMSLIAALALPAFAWNQEDGKGNKFMFGGVWMTDFGYWNRSKERTGTGSDNTQMMLNIPAHTRVFAQVESGQVGAYWELGVGTGLGNPTGGADISFISNRQVYGFYNFGNCQLLVGKAHCWLWAGLVPQQVLGTNLLTDYGFGFGNVYDGRFTQMRFTQNISKQFSYAISLVAPQTVTDSATSKVSYTQLPTLAAKFTLNFGVVSLFPAFAYSQVKWDNMPSGYDDNVTAWYGVLPVKVVAGPFAGIFQVGYGQNIGNLLTALNSYQVYQRLSNGAVKNTTAFNGYVDLGYTVGPITPHLMFGYDNASNSDAWKTGDSSNTRTWYGVALNYNVTPNFIITPEFSIFNFGKQVNTAGSPDIGKDWMAGLQFLFSF